MKNPYQRNPLKPPDLAPNRDRELSPISTDLQERAAEIGVELVDLATVMRESDFITVHTPLNPETKGLIGAKEIAMMKPTAFLINTARGPVVDEAALVEALKHRRIAGAGLDENGGAKLDHRAANRSCFWAE